MFLNTARVWQAFDNTRRVPVNIGRKRMDHENRKNENIETEIGVRQSLREGSDANRLEPSCWKEKSNHPSAASEG